MCVGKRFKVFFSIGGDEYLILLGLSSIPTYYTPFRIKEGDIEWMATDDGKYWVGKEIYLVKLVSGTKNIPEYENAQHFLAQVA